MRSVIKVLKYANIAELNIYVRIYDFIKVLHKVLDFYDDYIYELIYRVTHSDDLKLLKSSEFEDVCFGV